MTHSRSGSATKVQPNEALKRGSLSHGSVLVSPSDERLELPVTCGEFSQSRFLRESGDGDEAGFRIWIKERRVNGTIFHMGVRAGEYWKGGGS